MKDTESSDFHESTIGPFREWAQEYLDGGRWAGYDYYTAIKTELLERDKQVSELLTTLRAIVAALNQPCWNCSVQDFDEARLYSLCHMLKGDASFAKESARTAIARATGNQ